MPISTLRPAFTLIFARIGRRGLLLLAMVPALIILFGLLGYFWLPGFAKGKAEEMLSAKLHRPVTIERIAVQPYALALTVHGLRVGERAQDKSLDKADDKAGSEAGDKSAGNSVASGDGTLFSFESLHVNLSSMSLARRAPVISALTLKKPLLHLARGADGKLSVADLIEEFSNQPESEPSKFSVSNILIDGGRIEFDDRFKQSRQTVSDITLGLPFIANFESAEEAWVQPHFNARINDGAPIALTARARPFADKHELLLDLTLNDLDLTGIVEYAPVVTGLRLLGGKLDAKLAVNFLQNEGAAPAIKLSGDVVLRQLALNNEAGLPWKLAGERITLRLAELDPMLKRSAKASLDAANLRFKQGDKPELLLNTLAITDVLADPAAHAARFALDAKVNGKGRLQTSGNVAWAPLAADLKIDAQDVDIVALQGWVGDRFNATLTKGALSFSGKLNAKGTPLNVALQGDGSLADFNLLDRANATDLLRWRRLDVSGIALTTAPFNVAIDAVSLADFFARLLITPEGNLSLKNLVRQEDGPEAEDDAASTPPAKVSAPTGTGTVTAAPAPTPVTEAKPIRIGRILLQGGRIDFNDRFIKPNYRVNLTNLSGKIGPLDPGKPGMVDVRGAIDRSAPLEIRGKIDPFGAEMYVDISAKAKGIDLPTFSPYSGKYVGYAIEKGKLSVDVHYAIEKGQLRAENKIFLDQLTFGQKIDSPSALSIPVNLAVALLKNSRGEIDLNLPISGSLNDPEFSVGGIIVKVLVNLVVKGVTAPFALLGSLFGGGADLSQIDFAPGYARLTPESEKRLEALSKAMADRPGLKLEVTGAADPANDREGLKHAMLERRVKTQKLADLAKDGKTGGSLSEVELSAAEYPKYLERAYKNEKFDKPKNVIGLNKSLPVPEMEQLMLANLSATDDDLRNLAERRARSARDWLVAKGVPAERVFVLQPKVDAEGDGKKIGARAEFSLR